ncbi:MAG: NADH-quinone oxidoreductase subunit C [Planctomycetota bacterium]
MASQMFADLPTDLSSQIIDRTDHYGQECLYVQGADAYGVLEGLKSMHPELVLSDVTALDFLDRDMPERFCIVYVLQERKTREVARVHAWVSEEDPRIASVFPLWKLAKWGERECHDMFGIVFDGNPDLRRHLMPQDYPGFPLLKDYPLKGHGERAQFPNVVPEGDEMHVKEPTDYPITIGRGMHTPEYIEEMKEASKPRRDSEGKDA